MIGMDPNLYLQEALLNLIGSANPQMFFDNQQQASGPNAAAAANTGAGCNPETLRNQM